MNSFGSNEHYLGMNDPSFDMFAEFADMEQIASKGPQLDQQSQTNNKVAVDPANVILRLVMEYQIKATQQLGKIEEKLEKISQKSDDLEKKIDEQSKRLEKLETYSLERSQAIIERQNECIGLLESPGLRQRYAASDYGHDSDSLSDYSDSGFSQESESNSDIFTRHDLNYH
ncbi:uncharacterized protein FMAN_07330 [Fusarium mangiferae]|uniref:Uncharacterized protein n=1 Tax=Fusarium mangiferae TaxID=192010 RepID=A0A1L7T196_FUSMA|nr:uncharacterized protein FMAN_07330 [Fusarium mangiferae]CVK92434.1 uncharacterized protein FMAN_07330 [Fusarium mangiferae]